MQEALSCAEVMQGYLSRLRSDETFIEFYASVVKEAEQYTDDPVLPRYKRPPRKIDGVVLHQFKSPEGYYRSILKLSTWFQNKYQSVLAKNLCLFPRNWKNY